MIGSGLEHPPALRGRVFRRRPNPLQPGSFKIEAQTLLMNLVKSLTNPTVAPVNLTKKKALVPIAKIEGSNALENT